MTPSMPLKIKGVSKGTNSKPVTTEEGVLMPKRVIGKAKEAQKQGIKSISVPPELLRTLAEGYFKSGRSSQRRGALIEKIKEENFALRQQLAVVAEIMRLSGDSRLITGFDRSFESGNSQSMTGFDRGPTR